MSTVYIGIGSNLGNRQENCLQAVEFLGRKGITVIQKSSLYETAPWGVTEQPRFINMVVEAETDLSPRQLLDILKEIEHEMGRKKTERWGPRLIDLDILLFDDLHMQDNDLIIPHPLLHERTFVLEPLSEIAPEKMHPVFSKKMRQLLQEIRNSEKS